MHSIEELKRIATQVRRDILRMTNAAKSGHPGGSLGCADFLTALYFHILDHDPENFNMDGKGQDLFFLSNGHLSPAWYSVLARSGYFPVSELASFRKLSTRLQGHPATHENLPGIRISSGSLGQGLSVAIGAALAKKLNGDNKLVYCLTGDGEIQEGQIWEAAMFAPAHKTDNIIAVIDYNRKQIDGSTDDVIPLGNLLDKWKSFGWETLEMNGNDMTSIINIMDMAKSITGRKMPVMIIMKTEMGMGVDFMTGTHLWHGVAPNDDQLETALKQLDETLGDFKF